jgi:hypothetical protein
MDWSTKTFSRLFSIHHRLIEVKILLSINPAVMQITELIEGFVVVDCESLVLYAEAISSTVSSTTSKFSLRELAPARKLRRKNNQTGGCGGTFARTSGRAFFPEGVVSISRGLKFG